MKEEWADWDESSRRCMEHASRVDPFWTFLSGLVLMLGIEIF